MPVPGRRLEAEMVVRLELIGPARKKQTIRKVVPMMTWKPWKPVAMKKVEEKMPPPEVEGGMGVFIGLRRR